MGINADINNAFRVKLNSISSSPLIIWENLNIDPRGATHLRPKLIPAPAILLDHNKLQENTGMYSVGVYVKINQGEKELIDLLDEVENLFSGVISIVNYSDESTPGNTQIYILEIEPTKTRRVDEWLAANINIHYVNYN